MSRKCRSVLPQIRLQYETSQLITTQATLVVTPPSLLKQWVTEMRRHAPGLRICVYEGWRPLLRGIEARREVARRDLRLKREAAAKRKREAARVQTVRKYAKGAGGARIKREGSSENGEVIEIEDDEVDGGRGGDELGDASLTEITERAFIEYVRGHDVVITTYRYVSYHPPWRTQADR